MKRPRVALVAASRVGLPLAGVLLSGLCAATPAVAEPATAVPTGLIGAILMIAWDDIADLFKETSGSV
ncbi:hypothetical protein [Nonomuraea diastatica]|uniref:Uncharacterized protein n=1 Tax=Nonomuraea diastatica TaxID=1848329 RepID=A0A4R4VHZ1_9ACTN|nr:hypothetical protein [Nonomuraea diastatica]TDD05289.1 hypothetical protein E1294_49625 [Nonomuraea diastatica]